MSETDDARVRRVDEDRWLASRFAPAAVRNGLVALYAFAYEVARAPEQARDPALGAIRLQWWREEATKLFSARAAPAHPVLSPLVAYAPKLDPRLVETLIDARAADLEPAPFRSWEEVEAYADGTAGALMRLAAGLCLAGGLGESAPLIAASSRAWALVGLLRAEPYLAARGRTIWPPGPNPRAEAAARARAALGEAHRLRAPSDLFPAYAYVALAPAYLKAAERNAPPPSLFARQIQLLGAALTGRV